MKILFLTFYYPPDLSAGSFRAAALIDSLKNNLAPQDSIHILTTMPNRYDSISERFNRIGEHEEAGPLEITRIRLQPHQGSFFRLGLLFREFYDRSLSAVKDRRYDAVFATSSRFFTGYLAYRIARKQKIPLCLDIRDILIESLNNVEYKPLLRLMNKPLIPVLSRMEREVISYASRVNLVSPGFNAYFKTRYGSKEFSNFTNGVDDVFLRYMPSEERAIKKNRYIVLYAGNIGSAQALHKIIPYVDADLAPIFEFHIVGDGSARDLLQEALRTKPNLAVKLHPPVPRDELIRFYLDADIVFTHLDDTEAFKRVLPSKIFEYAIFGKPIIAGVSGYCADFLKRELVQSRVFDPCDVKQFNSILNEVVRNGIRQVSTAAFANRFRRASIMDEYAAELLDGFRSAGRSG